VIGIVATSTVEDYLKCIYLEERHQSGRLVAPGRISSAMNVAPGTVTAMLKTLTEAGLVGYEPYAGVRLTDAGRKLATHILRRHRLVEQFLVQVMGLDWSEVHEEAEILEHAVSDRIIDRMDEMLDRPSVDPHGDPIPTAGGAIDETDHPNLLACPLNTPMMIARIIDQRSEYLRLLERHHLMPGKTATVEARDSMAQTVLVVPEIGEPLRLGFHAASKILVRTAPSGT
jgi:DtxR family Mn-dependent transcriptional regulator